MRISVVIPSLNQNSVFEQGWHDVEVMVLDGGSADETLDVIQRNSHRLAYWRSRPDAGQAAAINEGFDRASGDIFSWLNSDDLYAPGALHEVTQLLSDQIDEPIICYGACELFWDGTERREIRPAVPFDRARLEIVDFLDQPSVFWTRAAWEKVGPLDDALHYAFDWDWFMRAAKTCRFISVNRLFSRYRIHKEHKSGSGGKDRWKEMVEVVRRYSPAEVLRHYEFLTEHPAAQWWLNKRMRLERRLGLFASPLRGIFADVMSPPFWFLPRDIRREVLWEISGIR
jgi:glycosyltransferase involved in cell wall biosynthesis